MASEQPSRRKPVIGYVLIGIGILGLLSLARPQRPVVIIPPQRPVAAERAMEAQEAAMERQAEAAERAVEAQEAAIERQAEASERAMAQVEREVEREVARAESYHPRMVTPPFFRFFNPLFWVRQIVAAVLGIMLLIMGLRIISHANGARAVPASGPQADV